MLPTTTMIASPISTYIHLERRRGIFLPHFCSSFPLAYHLLFFSTTFPKNIIVMCRKDSNKGSEREGFRHRPDATTQMLANIEVSHGHNTLLVCCMRAGSSSHSVPRGACNAARPTDLETRSLLFLIRDQ